MVLIADNRFYVGVDGPGPAVTCQACKSTGLKLYLNYTPFGLIAVCEGCYDYLEYLHDTHHPRPWTLRAVWN